MSDKKQHKSVVRIRSRETAETAGPLPSWKEIQASKKASNDFIRASEERMSKNVKFTPREGNQ